LCRRENRLQGELSREDVVFWEVSLGFDLRSALSSFWKEEQKQDNYLEQQQAQEMFLY